MMAVVSLKIGGRYYLSSTQVNACVLICPKDKVATDE